MLGLLAFDPGHATPRSARRERREVVPDRASGGPTRAPSCAIDNAGSHEDRIEGGLRALVGGLHRYDAPGRSLRRSGRILRYRAVTLAMARARLRVAVPSRHR